MTCTYLQALLLLLSLGADHRAICAGGSLAIHAAARHGHVSTLRPLVELGHYWASEADASGMQPLHHAAAGAHLDAVTTLLTEMVPVDARASRQRTPLMLAALAARQPGAATCVRLLLQSHADVNATDDFGNAALHLACKSCEREPHDIERCDGSSDVGRAGGGKTEVIDILCNAGARLFGQNRAGDTPLDLVEAGSSTRSALDAVLAARQRQGQHEANAALVARERMINRMRAMAKHDPMALQALCEEPETRKLLSRFNLTGFRIDAESLARMPSVPFSSAVVDEPLPSPSSGPISRERAIGDNGEESAQQAQVELQAQAEPPTERVTHSLRALLHSLESV